MEVILAVLQQIPIYLPHAVAILSALIALFLVIPGEQPEKTLQAIVDFLAKFSKK